MHMNSSQDPIHLLLSKDGGRNFQDVELKYSNLILNLEGGKDYILKTKETGTKFNFTITATDVSKENFSAGCFHENTFYSIGEYYTVWFNNEVQIYIFIRVKVVPINGKFSGLFQPKKEYLELTN